jgi:uncharacterized protein YprB with RNaseH-like and TPR domain
MQTVEELRRIIRRIETARPPRPGPEPPETALGGAVLETEHGALVAVRREYPLAHCHGRQPLTDAFDVGPTVLGLIARDGVRPDPRKLLFLDIETTGLSGGTGTYAFLAGVGYLDGGRFVLVQYFMRDLDEEPALLAALDPLLARTSAVVTFNGTGFDLPLLETRFILARRRWPAALPQVDLLRPARRLWSGTLDDCRLGTLERTVLGLDRGGDVPGMLIPSLYFEFLRHRRAARLVPVFAHNRNDVLSLAALLGWLARALAGAGGAGLSPGELAGVGRLWEAHDPERGIACYEAALGAGLAGPAARWVQLRLAWWEKRRARWEVACALWDAVARGGGGPFDARPWEELAKFHEHRARDAAAARQVVLQALGEARAVAAPARLLAALEHRLCRLERRLAGPGMAFSRSASE